MALTKSFKDTIQARALREPEFREGLLKESIECLLSGDTATGKIMLRDYINATVGFEELAELTGKSSKSLMRMFGPNGNPRANNLFSIIGMLQDKEGIHLEVHATR
ncbi:MAG: transcriptional regulator [Candidatus Brocadiaceae bacterium]|nr:transcriptional regulator [Candidatus Brocadiaceae bacterium]